jgi:DNA-directed RNA polymerase I, II, and III subunit RPABC2
MDDDEPYEAQDPDDVEHPDGSRRTPMNDGMGNDEDTRMDNVVAINDPTAANGEGRTKSATGKKMVGLREKKVPDEERTTTPYMTKYERARVLGTRALQIRLVVQYRDTFPRCKTDARYQYECAGSCRS